MNEGRPGALELIAMVLDEGSWRSWDTPPSDPAGLPASYAAELAAARARTGLTESVVTGEGNIDGRRVAVAACEFGFLAGSIGTAAAGRLVRCAERATAERLPLVASPASGGTRMQEGTPAFARMASISAAVARHRAAGLPYLVYLRHPTTGGVLASWGSLGHVTAAEPGALIGFLGPRVYQALHGEPFPAGVQRAENLAAHGLLDGVVPPGELREVAARALRVLAAGAEPAEQEPGAGPEQQPEPGAGPGVPGWESVQRSRRPERPGLRDLLAEAATDVSLLLGTGEGERDPALLLALARFGTEPCVVTGHDRRPGAELPPGPAGLRAAQRGMRLAAELGLPLVTVIDTAGAALSPEAEQGGLAGEIARALAALVALPAPTVCLLLGQGGGGGALALLPADRVLCAQHAWLAPLPPEGAAAILYRDPGRAAEAAARQRICSADLLREGIADRIIPERPDAADERAEFLRRSALTLQAELAGLRRSPPPDRAEARYQRYRRLGS
ncbi:MAG: acetyl-CoA carboxylase carboxyltransferase subunit alpha/beta [Nocardiopsaceae bacterium]|jgi:acetyl-CoA carboxylase carboxyl transferase subunit beta|nr:acetyl-CoA carboxylase carboxyltransferase subunit alpha/beta [Nocardiopsaceae bacterium]